MKKKEILGNQNCNVAVNNNKGFFCLNLLLLIDILIQLQLTTSNNIFKNCRRI